MRRLLLAAVLAGLTAVAGCSSSDGSSPSTAAASGASSKPAQELAHKLRAGTSRLTSAHIKVDAGSIGGTSEGNVTFKDGTATASDITLNQSGSTRIVTVGDTSYAKLPGGRNTSGKPWVVVSNDTSNEFVRALVGQVSIIKAAVSVPAIADLVASASSVRDLGTSAAGRHYALSLDMNRVKQTTLGAQLATLGTNPLPVDIYLDAKNRPAQVTISARLGRQSLPITITAGKFNAPVTITAPPANEVAQ
ncbi:MAG TPA: hypothetical protein VGH43_21000 [Jatrophihabitans sp.]